MKAGLLWLFVILSLAPVLSGICETSHLAVAGPTAQSLTEYFEPGTVRDDEPLPIKQVIGLIIAGLSAFVILLFVFSFLMGPGEEIREKMSEASDPFFTIVATLLVVLFLALLQAYYTDIIAWLKNIVSSG